MNYITIFGLVAATCTTISFLPQALKTIRTKDTKSISLSMYSLFAFGTMVWLIYGILSENVPIIIANSITFLFAIIILVYKMKFK